MKKIIAALVLGNFLNINLAHTCTRVTYLGSENTVITARSMDWRRDTVTNLWAFKHGIKRDGAAGPKSITWTSKYTSVTASFFDKATADGMNEKGLVANLLYLAESEYPKPTKSEKRLPLGVALWAQYILDNFATVKEALNNLEKENFYIVPVNTPDGEPGTVHLAISDSLGDSAILEYIKGKLIIHSSRQYQVMTNSPSFDQQLAISAYWEKIGGVNMLPGTSSAADRFVRASYYIKITPKIADIHEALASVFSIIRNTSTPMGVSEPGRPNIAPTSWRTVSDQKNKRYYFESCTSPNIFWVDLPDIKFDAGENVKKLSLGKNIIYSGNVADKFQKSEPFKFLQSP